jgi:hypothetical protein
MHRTACPVLMTLTLVLSSAGATSGGPQAAPEPQAVPTPQATPTPSPTAESATPPEASGFTVHALFDSRDGSINPSRGVYANLDYQMFFKGFLGGSSTWLRLDFDLPATGMDTYGRAGRGYPQGRYPERALVIGDLARAGQLTSVFSVTGIGPTLDGRNGGGDRYWIDGELEVGTLATAAEAGHATAARLASPVPVQVKDTLWGWLGAAVQPAEDR